MLMERSVTSEVHLGTSHITDMDQAISMMASTFDNTIGSLLLKSVRDSLPFQVNTFTNLRIVEEVDGTANPRDIREGLESKGRISLEFRFISNLRKSPREPSKEPTQHLRAIGAVPEKALKGDARSHQATFVTVPNLLVRKLTLSAD
jgi:hypothetical protein